MKPSRLRTSSGFTLTEIMVTLTIMGIVMLFSIPNLQRANETHRLNQATGEIENVMKRARVLAVTTRSNVRVSVNAAARSIVVAQDTDQDGTFETSLRTVMIHAGVSLADVAFGGGGTIIFDDRGAPDNPGSIRLEIDAENQRLLVVSPGSGAVTIRNHEQTVAMTS